MFFLFITVRVFGIAEVDLWFIYAKAIECIPDHCRKILYSESY